LKLHYDETFSNFGINSNLRRYNKETQEFYYVPYDPFPTTKVNAPVLGNFAV